MEKVRQDKNIINFISDFDKTGNIIACICSGTQMLISAKIVKGRKVCGYYSMRDDMETMKVVGFFVETSHTSIVYGIKSDQIQNHRTT